MNAFISSSFVFWLTLALTCWAEISVVGRLVLGAARYWAKGSGGGWRYHERFLHSAPTTTTSTTTSSSHPAQQRPGESFLSQLLISDRTEPAHLTSDSLITLGVLCQDDDDETERKLCKDKSAGELFRLKEGEENCRDVIQCTAAVSYITIIIPPLPPPLSPHI